MYIQRKNLVFLTYAVLMLVGCEPKKQEKTPPAPLNGSEKMKQPPLPLQPKQKKSVKPEGCEDLTPKECAELKINEDEVMNPFPGSFKF